MTSPLAAPLNRKSAPNHPRTGLKLLLLILSTIAIPLLAVLYAHLPAPRPRVLSSDEPAASPPAAPDPPAKQPAPESPPPLPQCGHVVLFSAARHGSTWLLNSVERCRFSANYTGHYSKDINKISELWNIGQRGPLLNIAPRDAAAYAARNTSVKVFPISVARGARDEGRGLQDLRVFLAEVVRLRVPVIVLRRQLEDAYGSLVAAMESGVWKRHLPKEGGESKRKRRGRRDRGSDPRYLAYRQKKAEYFEMSGRMLREAGAKVDVLWYERIVGERFIVAKEARCYVKNCNF